MTGPFAGRMGYVIINGVPRALGSWDLSLQNRIVTWQHFKDGGFDQNLLGRYSATLTIEGAMTSELAGLTLGQTYNFILGVGDDGVNPAYQFAVTARISSIQPRVQVGATEPSGVTIQAAVTGVFPTELP